MAREIEKIKSFCASSGIFRAAKGFRAVIVGLSGGADSSFLLSVIGEVFPELDVAAAHLDHMIRGDEAKRDRDFCRELCKGLGVRFFEGEADIYAIAEKEGKSAEEAGRDERYAFFRKCRKELAKELGAKEEEILVATAHNADDNLETVIFNLTRGAGLRGLCGIPPVRDGYIIRPMLALTSDEIRDHCRREGISYVVDSTNLEDGYTRNRIRHNVIPELKKINPSVAETVAGTSLTLAADSAFLDALASDGALDAEYLLSAPAPVASRVIASAFREASGHAADRVSVETVLASLRSGGHGRLHLPHGVTAYYGDTLEFVVESDKNEKISFMFDAAEGEHMMREYGFSIAFYPAGRECEKEEIYKELIYKIGIDDKIKNNLYVRNRRDGDRILIGGHHRRLKKLLCDAGVPLRKRDMLPVVCDGDGVVWVPGFPVRDGAAAKDGEGITILYYEFGKEDCNG